MAMIRVEEKKKKSLRISSGTHSSTMLHGLHQESSKQGTPRWGNLQQNPLGCDSKLLKLDSSFFHLTLYWGNMFYIYYFIIKMHINKYKDKLLGVHIAIFKNWDRSVMTTFWGMLSDHSDMTFDSVSEAVL